MKNIIAALAFSAAAFSGSAQIVHEYASVEYSPAIRKLGVFATDAPNKVVDMKVVHMDRSDLDIVTFFNEVQDMEKRGWEVVEQDIVALDKGVHMYVWILRKPKP